MKPIRLYLPLAAFLSLALAVAADNLDLTTFTAADVGPPALAGTSTIAAEGVDITVGGLDIAGSADEFHFLYQTRTNDFDVAVRVESLANSDVWAKAGLMARETLDTNSAHVSVLASPTLAGCFLETRASAGGVTALQGSFPVNYPQNWLRLQRTGDVFNGYASLDGRTWNLLGSASLTIPNPLYFGLALSSHSTNRLTSARFRDLSYVTNALVGANPLSRREPLGPSSRKTGLVISEIMYKPAPRTDGKILEYVELFNANPFWEDISGYRLTGDIEFTFPTNTILAGGAFLVVAGAPGDLQSVYGITNAVGPYTGSLKRSGTVRLRNDRGAIYLQIPYSNKPPWPVAADGTGHSLVLARPSYGEGFAKAWDSSEITGGSPGAVDSYRPDPLRSVVINEILAHTDDPLLDYIELYNHSNEPVDLSGCILSDDPDTNKFLIQNTVIPARGFVAFDQSKLGFALSAGGETIYFKSPNGARMLDAVQFGGQENGVSTGRYPDGAEDLYRLSTRTPGLPNSDIRVSDVVINEIMYAPITGDNNDEYVELYNRGTNAVDLGGWKISDGIDFTVPPGTVLGPNAYLVVANNAAHLRTNYSNLNAGNTLGDFGGNLRKGERLALSMPDEIVTTNQQGVVETSTIYIDVDEVTYESGGRWGHWANEGGSSLELIDPRANHRLPSNWADSDETGKSLWTTIEATDVLDNGAGDPADNLQVVLLGEGECLLDNVEVISAADGTNRVTNATFEGGLTGWTPQGDHVRSTLETTSGFESSQSLHIRASARGDTGANRVWGRLGTRLNPYDTATIRAKVRWLHGWPELVLRFHGNWMEATGRMAVPANLGTPGAPNSRAVNNAGPAIHQIAHHPIVPAANEPVVVTARVHDPDGAASVVLNYRIDPAISYSTVPMTDDGTAGDAVAGDGIFSGQIPGQASGLVAFYVQATDGPGATTAFPADAPARECLVRFNDPTPTLSFGIYRQWFTAKGISTWINRPVLSNEPVDGTFVYGNYRVIYNFGSHYAGSPYHQGFPTPLSGCHYSIDFPQDDLLLGTENFNKVHAPGNGPFDDGSIQREQTCFWLVRKLGLPWLYRRCVAMYVNGNRRGILMEDTQVPGSDVIDEQFPDDADGFLYKLQPWFEFANSNGQQMGFNNNSWCTLNNYLGADGNKKLARYRWNYLSRAVSGSANNYTNVFALIDAANSGDPARLESEADMEQWMRTFAVEHAVGNWDAFGCQNAQNMYGYKPLNGKWTLFIWDYNIVLGNSGSWGPGENLFSINFADGPMWTIYNTPPFRRAYWRALKELCTGPMLATNVNAIVDAKYAAFRASGANASTPSALKSYIASARTSILSQLAAEDSSSFSASGPGTTANNLVPLTGNAPVEVKTITVNGVAYPLTWDSVTSWRLTVPVNAARTTLSVRAFDIHGNPLPNFTATVTVNYTGAVELPQDHIVINEIMYHPAVPNAEFVELFNNSTSHAFDLSNFRLNGADFTFASGTIIPPNGFLVIVQDPAVFADTYGGSIPIAGTFDGQLDNGGETLSLIQPGATPEQEVVVARVRYDRSPPWPALADGTGVSLQLIDPMQDNNRVGNWAAVDTNNVPPPAWKLVTVTGAASSSRLYLYLTSAGDVHLDDLMLVAGSVAGVGPNLIKNGDFESALTPPWNVSPNLAGTVIDTAVKYSGNASLHLTAASAGTTQTNSIWQDTTPLVNGQQYTLSYWYLPSTNGSALTIRLSGGGLVSTHGIQVPKTILDPATPGAANNVLASLPAFPPLWLNELQADNLGPVADHLGDFDPWLELFNAGTNRLDLSTYFLSGNYSNLTQWPFPPGAAIDPRGFVVVWLDGEPAEATATEFHANFRLASGSGSAALSRLVNDKPQVIDYLDYNQLSPGRSVGRYPDGQNEAPRVFDYPSPGATNYALSRPVTVWINEWMAANTHTLTNPVGGKFDDWFEIYNPSSNAVDLTGYYLTDNLTNTANFIIPPGKVIPPGAFLMVWADSNAGQNSTNRSELHTNFKLNQDGEAIGLFAPDGTLIDAVVFGPQTDDVSQGRWPDASGASANFFLQPTPGRSNVLPTSRYAPVLAPVGNQTVPLGSPLSFVVSATDADVPAQTLTFSLGANAPSGASIDPGEGSFSWTPTAAEGSGVYALTLRVTDNGSPSLSDEETIQVTVTNPGSVQITRATLSSPGSITLQWVTDPARTYEVQYKNDLNDLSWQNLSGTITNSPTANFTDTLGASGQRFYRIRAF